MRAVAIAVCLLVARPTIGEQEKRAAVPDASTQKEAEKTIRDVFKDEYAKKDAPSRKAFAAKLLKQAGETRDDPAARFVLLREARDLAALAGDAAGAVQAIDALAGQFDVDALRMKLAVITAVAQEARAADALKAVAESLLKVAEEASAGEDVETAEKAATAAIAAARKAKDVPLTTKAEAKSREVADFKSKQTRVKAARETLAANPNDPASNLEVGQFECFTKGNWETGLPLLAKSSNEALKSLAQKELANPDQTPEQVGLGDAWWDRAEKEAGPARQKARERAALWYGKAVANLTGLLKVKIEKRLASLESKPTSEVKAKPSAPSFDPVGTWTKQDTGTRFFFKPNGILEVPQSQNKNYASGKWERVGESIVLNFPNGEKIDLNILDTDSLSGTIWKFKRNK